MSHKILSFLLLVLVAILATSVTHSVAATPAGVTNTPFSFYDFFSGEWEVRKGTGLFATGDIELEAVEGRYLLQKDNTSLSLALLGNYYENNTETLEISSRLNVRIEFEDNSTGTFYTGAVDESDNFAAVETESLNALFSFSFAHHSWMPIPMSVGEWHGANGDHCTITIVGPERFTIIVSSKSSTAASSSTPEEEDHTSITVYQLSKVAVPSPKTFWQQYGTWIMFGGVFIMNIWFKSKFQPPAAPAPPAAQR